MTSYTTLVSTAIYLALNLMVFGSVIALVVAVAFKLLPTTLPRARYLIAVAAFCVALTLPILATLGLTKSSSPPAMDERTSGPASGNALSIEAGAASGGAPSTALVTRIAQRLARSAMAPVFFWLWLAVSALLALRELVGHMRLLRARRGWRPATDAMRLALNWPDRVPLYLDHGAGPSAVGWLRPAVALPSWLFDDLPPMTARRIAAHELAHARWRDPMVNALLRLALALLWPAAPLWFLERLAGVEREAAADQAAIDGDTNVISARASAGSRHPLVEQKAVEAARRWRFAPAKMEGRPIKVVGDLTFFGQMDLSKRWVEIR